MYIIVGLLVVVTVYSYGYNQGYFAGMTEEMKSNNERMMSDHDYILNLEQALSEKLDKICNIS